MVNLQDLKNIDLKNLDVNKLTALLLERKELLAQVIVIGVSIVILLWMFNGYRSQEQGLQQEVGQLKEKADVVTTHDDITAKTKKWVGNLPKELNEDELSSQLTDYAAQNNVTVLSFSPGQKKEETLSVTTWVSMFIQVSEYKDFLSFIQTIEKSPFALRVDTCFLTVPTTGEESNAAEKNVNVIEAKIEISSVSIKK